MILNKRTSHPNPQPTSIQTLRHAHQLAKAAQQLFNSSQQKAFNQGISDFENSTRDHPPYGFHDLRQAWQLGWLAGKQKSEGLGSSERAADKRKCAG
jgi:hypothetical protein